MEEQHKKSHFWKGALCGALAMFLAGTCATALLQENALPLLSAVTGSGQKSGLSDDKLEELKKLIQEEYLYADEIDEEDLQEGIYTGYINALGDPYSVYYDAGQTRELMESTSGEYYGIGVVMSQDLETKITTAVQVYEGSPAEKAGIRAEDIIYKVDGEDVTTADISEIAQKVRGAEGTEVVITVLRGEEAEKIEFTVERQKVEVTTVSFRMLEEQIGYIRITEFDTVTYEQFEKAFTDLKEKGMDALIVDVRSNPGGNLLTVSEILDLLLPEGVIVYTEDKEGNREYLRSDEEHKYEDPVAVLVNGSSASASEIFAGAIQDYRLGPIVGTTTYGKGVVQKIVDLGDGSCVKLTISQYFTPEGRSIQGKGVEPDVEVEYSWDENNPEADNQLEEAVDRLLEKMEE